MSRLIQFHQVKLKDTDATENRPAYCVRMFSTTMYYMCDLDVASLAHELVFFLFACLPMAQTKNMTSREGYLA